MMWKLWVIVVGATAAQGFVMRSAFEGRVELWLVLGLCYAVLGGLALRGLWDRGRLTERLRPRFGDVTLGTVVATILLVGSWAGRALFAPVESARHGWLLRIYLLFGDPNTIQRSWPVTLALLSIAALDEIVWRGFVLDLLTDRYGYRRAFFRCWLCYAIPALPTLVTLGDPEAGPNPLWLLALLGAGLFWTLLARLTGRLPPSIISHWVVAYFSAVQFQLPGLTLVTHS